MSVHIKPTTVAVRYDALQAATVAPAPFKNLIIKDFISPDTEAGAAADFPKVPDAGLYPPETVKVEGDFKRVMDEITSDRFRDLVESKFEVSLKDLPQMYTIRGFCRKDDGGIHTDSTTKVITVLLYFNEKPWPFEKGKLRLLSKPDDLEAVLEEVSPDAGTMIVFERSNASWHGHYPYEGPRKAIQLNWVISKGVQSREHARHLMSARFKSIKRKLLGG